MRSAITFFILFTTVTCLAQTNNITGTYTNGIAMPKLTITFNADSTFQYTSTEHPTFYRWEDFAEKGSWSLKGDTLILNPQLNKKPYVETAFEATENKGDTTLLLTFKHIKRYFDAQGRVVKTDTLQIKQLDYVFNHLKRKQFTRVATSQSVRCMFAGYIPKEVITQNHTIAIQKPTYPSPAFLLAAYELMCTKEFKIDNPNANRLTLNVYSNYYEDGQIRQMKFLVKNENELYTQLNENGQFEMDTFWNVADGKDQKKQLKSVNQQLTLNPATSSKHTATKTCYFNFQKNQLQLNTVTATLKNNSPFSTHHSQISRILLRRKWPAVFSKH